MAYCDNKIKSLEDEKINILLELLICPKTGHKLKFDKKYQVFVSEEGNLIFHYENGIPNMLLEESESIDSFYAGKDFDKNNFIYAKDVQ